MPSILPDLSLTRNFGTPSKIFSSHPFRGFQRVFLKRPEISHSLYMGLRLKLSKPLLNVRLERLHREGFLLELSNHANGLLSVRIGIETNRTRRYPVYD